MDWQGEIADSTGDRMTRFATVEFRRSLEVPFQSLKSRRIQGEYYRGSGSIEVVVVDRVESTGINQ
jgi:hypothetical protein